jgi:hypothetical protein
VGVDTHLSSLNAEGNASPGTLHSPSQNYPPHNKASSLPPKVLSVGTSGDRGAVGTLVDSVTRSWWVLSEEGRRERREKIQQRTRCVRGSCWSTAWRCSARGLAEREARTPISRHFKLSSTAISSHSGSSTGRWWHDGCLHRPLFSNDF